MKKLNLKTYLIEVYENDKGQIVEVRNNKGFSPPYLLGMLERIQFEIINQIENQAIKPSIKKLYADGKKIDSKMLALRAQEPK